MNIIKTLYLVFIITVAFSCSKTKKEPQKSIANKKEISTNKVLLSSEIEWKKLNPARGNNSPKAGTIWGDRKGTVATGFLAKFVDGFSSPSHIHNVSYRAVVIKGLIHNDDPKAENMWMPSGSFWTQPVGEPHITSAKGDENIAYVEIDNGPYLVKPITEAFDSRERPINIDAGNIFWLDSSKTNWIEKKSKAEISFLWKSKNNLKGLFIKLPVEFKGKINSNGRIFHAIVIQGILKYQMPNETKEKILDPGSYFSSEGESIHSISSDANKETIIYIRTNGNLNITTE